MRSRRRFPPRQLAHGAKPAKGSGAVPSGTVLFVAAVAGIVAIATGARAATVPTAVAMVASPDTSTAELDAVESAVRAALSGLAVVQPHDDTTALMEDARAMGLTCDLHASDCAARFGALAGTVEVLLVDVAGVGDRLHVGMTRVDVNIGGSVSSFVACKRDDSGLAPVIEQTVKRLYQPAGALGRARLTGVPPSATVLVDGSVRGTSPLPWPVDGLSPGEHEAVISQVGVPTKRITFTVAPGEARAVPVPGGAGGAVPTPTTSSIGQPAAPTSEGPLPAASGSGLPPLVVAGGVTAGAGALVAVSAGIGAGAIGAALEGPMLYSDRVAARTMGAVFLTGVAIGAVGAITGGALIALGASP